LCSNPAVKKGVKNVRAVNGRPAFRGWKKRQNGGMDGLK